MINVRKIKSIIHKLSQKMRIRYYFSKRKKFLTYCDILVKNESDLLFISDMESNFQFISNASKLFFSIKDFNEFKNFTIKFYSDYLKEIFDDALKNNNRAYPYLEFPIKGKSGRYIWVRLYVKIVKIQEIVLFIGTIKDINIQLNLYGSNQSNVWFNIVKNSKNGVLVENTDHQILFLNDALLSFFESEFHPSHFIGKSSLELIKSFNDLLIYPQFFLDYNEKPVDQQTEQKSDLLILKNGKTLERNFVKIINPNGQFSHIWYFKDITDSFTVSEKIKESEEKHRRIIENMELGILEVDNNDVIVKVYDHFCQLSGYTKEELIGQKANELLLKPESKEIFEINQNKREQGLSSTYEIPLVRKNGTLAWLLVSGTPVYNNKNEKIGSVGIHYDITDRKKLEQDLKQANIAANKATEMEKIFLASMTHELKTPINAILGMSDLLKTTDLDNEQKDYLQILETSTNFLQKLISDILDISKIETGNIDLNIQPFNLKKIIADVISSFEYSLGKKKVNLIFDWQLQLNNCILGDPLVLQQIVTNLLSNAEKFTDEGFVKLSVECLNQTDHKIKIRFIVEDTGIGIDVENLDSVFEKFIQLPNQKRHKSQGTGLGLSIVKSLVNIQNGVINVSSVKGKGSVFSFDLTYEKCSETLKVKEESKTNKRPPNMSFSDFKVLIVEDNILNQEYLTRLFNKWAIYHEIANSGEEAIERFANTNFDCVMMDIQLPGIDGLETSKRLRSSFPNQDFFIIAMTAVIFTNMEVEVLTYGINAIIKKPFTTDELYEKIAYYFEDYKKNRQTIEKINFHSELDSDFLHEFYGNDIEYATNVFDKFNNIYLKLFKSLVNNSDDRTKNEIKKWLHSIKPSFKMVGLSDVELAIDELIKNENFNHSSLRKVFSNDDIYGIELLIEKQILELKRQR